MHARRRAIVLAGSVAVILSALIAPMPVFAAGISGVNYALNGQAANATIPASSAITTFTPTQTVTGTNTVTLTFPNGTTLVGLTAADVTCQQGAGSQQAAATLTATGSGGANPQIAITCPSGSLGTAGTTFTVGTSGTGGGKITNPTAAGSGTFTVSIDTGDSRSIPTTVTPGPVSASNSTFIASPSSVPANNSTTSSLTLTLKDAFGNNITTVKSVQIVQSGGTASPSIASTNGTTAGGVYSTTTKSNNPGSAVYQATDTSDGVTITAQPAVTFTPTGGSSANCGPSGGTIDQGTVVNCTFTIGTGYDGNLAWTAPAFSPPSSGSGSPSFTAGTTNGPATIQATWSDAGVSQSATFSYTIQSPTGTSSSVACGPAGGSSSGTAVTVAAGSTVTCSFTAGTGYNNDFSWSASHFSPTSSGTSPTIFTANNIAGAATITGTWSDASGSHSVTNYYTISTTASSLTCGPAGGSTSGTAVTIAAGSTVTCSFTQGAGYNNDFAWTASHFSPTSGGASPTTFTANNVAGQATITGTWSDGSGSHSVTNYYTISTSASSVVCNPSGGTIPVGQVVNCTFNPGTGAGAVSWTASHFTPTSSSNTNEIFTAGATSGAASITATWSDASGNHTQQFTYTISASDSSVSCSPPAGTIAAGQMVPCTFTPGNAVTTAPSWTATDFTPAGPVAGNSQTFTAGGTAGPATITVTWADGGVNKSQTFSYTVSTTASAVSCDPSSGSLAIGSVVNCSYNPGTGAGAVTWSSSANLAPSGGPNSVALSFTAQTPAGPGSISASWANSSGSHVVTFPYTITATASSVTCTPASGPISSGQAVPCAFTAGNNVTAGPGWTATNFTPAGPVGGNNPVFTAGSTAGAATITVVWADGGVNKSQTFSYTVSTTASAISCNPASGTLADGQIVNCSFNPGSGYTGGSLLWTTSHFVQPGSTALNPNFTAGTTSGPASINATWTDASGNHSVTFSYAISTTASTVVCSPLSGATIAAGSTVNCTFNAGAGYNTDLAWTASHFTPTSTGSGTPSFLADNFNGTGTISATWSDGAGPHNVQFTYTISTTASSISCNPAGGTIAASQIVNCTFNAGTGFTGTITWTASHFTPGSTTAVNPAFTADTTAGPASITATWADASGNHSQTFSYTIDTAASGVVCSPATGATIAAGSAVNCTFNPGPGYGGNLAWTASHFSPISTTSTTPSFTANNFSGTGTISATWNDGAGFHSATFTYTITTTASSVACNPPGGSVIPGQAVNCSFNAGSGYNTDLAWTTSHFSPPSSGLTNPIFTAGAVSGPATITATWSDSDGSHSQTFSYTINASDSSVACTPTGGTIAAGQAVPCTFTSGNAVTTAPSWTTTNFTPAGPVGGTNPVFTAGSTAGAGTITVTWADGGVNKSQTFSYTISTTASSATCNPASGNLAIGTVVNCSFDPGTGAGAVTWSSSPNLTPSGGPNSVALSFTAGTPAGPGSISASWTDASGSHIVTFGYTITATASTPSCSPASGTISSGQAVSCTFTPGNNVTSPASWTASDFAPAGPVVANSQVFTAGTVAGPGSITVTWADGGVSKSQTFSYTISTTASTVSCNPASGTLADSQVVNCSFNPGSGYVGGSLHWSTSHFTPANSPNLNPNFTAGTTSGPASINATWTDASGNHSVTFSYAISTTASTVVCSPLSGATIAAGSTVNCTFNAGAGYNTDLAWTASHFTPTSTGSGTPSFLADNFNGTGTISATWSDGAGPHNVQFTYTISTTASSATCAPPNGALVSGQVVNCSFNPGSGYNSDLLWSTSDFTPPSSVLVNQAFTAGSANGPASITATWSDASGNHSQTFPYTVSTSPSSATCNPASGTVASGSVINCSFNAGSGAGPVTWSSTGSLSPNGGPNSTSLSFTVGNTAGPATISASWTDASGSHVQSFNYTVSTTASSVTCSPAGGTIAAGSGVNCVFTPGTGLSAGPTWTAPAFNPTASTDTNPTFVAGATLGAATIQVSWTDASGSHGQTFSYTISGDASAASCNPAGGTVQTGQVVNCAFSAGTGYLGLSLVWTSSDFSPSTSPSFGPAFTAGTTAGPGSITAQWTDGSGFHSQSFNYTISTTASTAVCSPPNLSTIAASSTVTCTFNAGSGYNSDLAWTASNFTPPTSNVTPATFTAAATSGMGTIGVTWSDGSGFHSLNFTYTITATASSVTCNPAGGAIAGNQVVNCSFSAGSGYVGGSLSWTSSNFAPPSSPNPTVAFTANNVAGPSSITATWTDGSGVHGQSFNYTVNTTTSAATCSPSGGTIPASSTVNCSFTASIGYVNGSLSWTLTSGLTFTPGSGAGSVSPSITAGTTAGPQTITANWQDASGNRSQSFNYTIGATPSVVACSPVNGSIAPGSVINCSFTPGTGYASNLAWTASNFTPTSTSVTNPTFTAGTTFGAATITASWTDAEGTHAQSFGYTISNSASSVNCSPISGTSFAPGTLVNCLFTPGSAYVAGSLGWTAFNFTPPTSTSNGQAFTAGSNGGLASVTATWNDGAGTRTQTFSYTVVVSVVACVPGAGQLQSGTVVICSFIGAPGATFTGWAAAGFSPSTAATAGATFVAGSVTPTATITGSWTDAGGAHSAVFQYSIIPAPAPVVLLRTSVKASSALGKTQDPADFTVGTKVATINSRTNNVVTIKFTMSPSMAGKKLLIFRAIRSCTSSGTGPTCATGRRYGGWSGFSLYTSRIVDAQGNAYIYLSAHGAQWLSFYGFYPGDAVQGVGRSQTQQLRDVLGR